LTVPLPQKESALSLKGALRSNAIAQALLLH
jgi:hypothetical protein